MSSQESVVEYEDPLTDVALVVDGTRFFTSKSLLALASPVFRCMFTSRFREKEQQEIELPNKNPSDISEFLDFINPGTSDDLKDGVESALRLLPIAEEYQVGKLRDKCEEAILQEIESDKPQDFILHCVKIAERFNLESLLRYCVEKFSLSKSLWTLLKESDDISLEVKTRIYEARLQKLEAEKEDHICLKQRMKTVRHRLRDIVTPHENHCRCRTELKLRSPMQRTCNFCARIWCSDHVSTDAYRSSYWFFCNHRIGYSVVNDNVLRNFIETKEI